MSSPTTSSSSAVGPVVGRHCAAAQNTLSSTSGTHKIRSLNARSASMSHWSTSPASHRVSFADRSLCSAITSVIESMPLMLVAWRSRPGHHVGLEGCGGPVAEWTVAPPGADRREETHMGKTGRKRRARRKGKANHGKRPNA